MNVKCGAICATLALSVLSSWSVGFAQSGGMSFVKTDTGDFLGVGETPQGEATFLVLYGNGYYCGGLPKKCKDSIKFSSQVIDAGTREPLLNPSLERNESVVVRVCYPSGSYTGGFWDETKKNFTGKPYDVVNLETVDCEYTGSSHGGLVLKSDSGIQKMNPMTMDAERQKPGLDKMLDRITKEQKCNLVMYYRECPRP